MPIGCVWILASHEKLISPQELYSWHSLYLMYIRLTSWTVAIYMSVIYVYVHKKIFRILHTYMFVVNFDALAQASNFRIKRRHIVFHCWMQDSKLGSLRHQIASRLNAHSQTDWAIENQSKIRTQQPVPMMSEHSAHLTSLHRRVKIASSKIGNRLSPQMYHVRESSGKTHECHATGPWLESQWVKSVFPRKLYPMVQLFLLANELSWN